jgi:hypothetical protein
MSIEVLELPEVVEIPIDQDEIKRSLIKNWHIYAPCRRIVEATEEYKYELQERCETAESNINALLDHWPNGEPREGVKPGTNKLKPLE